jgi:hypothetical protein
MKEKPEKDDDAAKKKQQEKKVRPSPVCWV